jgi:two-component system, cell cycle sensor histidine kinase and response regulator CckA
MSDMDEVSERPKLRIMGPLRSRSISRELAVSLVLLVLFFEGVMLLSLYNRQADYLYQEIQKKADEYMLSLSETLAVPVWDYDTKQIRRIGEGFARNDLIDAIHILSAEGGVLFQFDRSSGEGRHIERTIGIQHEGQEIGRVQIRLSLDTYRHDLAWLSNTLIMVLAISLVVIVITTGALLRVLMRKPLTILQNGIDRVAQGDFEHRLDAVKHSELAGIARRFNEMAIEIRGRERSLQKEIADRKQAEEMLRRSEENFRRSLEDSPLGVRIVNNEGETIYANQAMLNIYGYDSIQDWKTTPAKKRYTPGSYAEFQIRREKRKQGDYNPSEYEVSIIRKDDEVRHLRVVRKEILWDDERQFQVICQDITDYKQAEEERRTLQERLHRAEKMEALGTLAGGVAHDLNNVLGIVVGYAELLLTKVDQSNSIRPGLLNIMNGGERAAAIVQDLLTLARRGVSGRQVLNLNQIVVDFQQSPEFERLSSHNPHVRTKADLEEDLLNISGSSVHLMKTIFNLVSNAIEAMPNGGILTIKTANQYLDRPIQGYDKVREGDYVVLSISDTGEGIPAHDLKRIFEPFYTKKVMGRSGTGLGLSVVWGTVKDHDGYVNVQSEEGKGSIFTLYFPVTREEISAEHVAVSISEYMGKGESILVVDDVDGQRDLAADMLRNLNYGVASVCSGEEAVEYIKQHTVDMVVLDMIMDPGMDGLDTYRKLLEIHPRQKAIIVSGFSETERVTKAQELGAGAYVKKPYVLEKLGLAVRTELDRVT